MDIKAVEKAAQKIQASLFKNSNSYSIGMLKSHFRGSGLQFKEHQIYTHGDDVRFIDWKLYAKTNTPYIKTFEEERNVEIVVFLDAGQSMLFGHKGVSKLQASVEICGLLYLLAKETKDSVQVVVMDNEINCLPKKAGKEGIVHLISLLESRNILNNNAEVNIFRKQNSFVSNRRRVSELTKYLSKKKEVIILSDFNYFLPVQDLKKLLYKANLHCFQVLSPLDEASEIPYPVHAYDTNSAIEKSHSVYGIGTRGNQNELQQILGRKFKTLNVKNRYLEDFIKEML